MNRSTCIPPRATRWTLFHLVVAFALTSSLVGCSSTTESASMGDPAPPPETSAQVRPAAEIQELRLEDGAEGAVLEIDADRSLVWTSFRNSEGDLVIELSNTTPAETVADLRPDTGLVNAVEIERLEDGDRPLTRMTVRTREPSQHSLSGEDSSLLLELTRIGGGAPVELAYEPLEPEPESEAPVYEPAAPQPAAPQPAAPEAAATVSSAEPARDERGYAIPQTYGTPDAPQVGPAPGGVPASQLFDVRVDQGIDGTTVRVEGDGEFSYSTFRLQNPERFVIDLEGVVNTGARSTISVGGQLVEQIRVGQFKPRPEPVSRVVFDLATFESPTIQRGDDGLVIRFGEAAPADATAPVEVAEAEEEEPPVGETLAEETAPPQPKDEDVRMADAGDTVAGDTAAGDAADEPVTAGETIPAEEREEAPPEEEAVAEVYEPDPVYGEPEEAPEPEVPAVVAESAQPRDPQNVPVYEAPQPVAPAGRGTGADVSEFEAQELDVATPEERRERVLESFGSVVVSRDDREYVGEPISMSLRNADLVETLRSFAKISDLNLVIQPGVRGSVTVELESVPWDQAMEQILKINNLGMDIDGTIVRIAPLAQLQEEAAAEAKLRAARSRSVPLRTVMRSLSYAQAGEVASVLRRSTASQLLSNRASIEVFQPTNTMIISELPERIDTVLAVIDNLDVPEPQVSIEARIVEATKNFGRSLGIQWGYDYEASQAAGNTTGLIFPNNVDSDGGVGLLTGGANGFLNLSMGNILDTFRLNARLQVAESEGLINIVSAPRVTTLNNSSASIQSGFQIPIQTVSDRTVSVQFVNATLQMQVTPQVTAEGTVLLDINVAKRAPQFGLQVPGGAGAPISTKEAQTRVLVRDGATVVIGGIYEVQTDQGQDRVPGLANVPILGHLFKNRDRNDSNNELMIFITPRIVQP